MFFFCFLFIEWTIIGYEKDFPGNTQAHNSVVISLIIKKMNKLSIDQENFTWCPRANREQQRVKTVSPFCLPHSYITSMEASVIDCGKSFINTEKRELGQELILGVHLGIQRLMF